MAHPLALQLRTLQSLVEIGVDKNTMVVFPAPLVSTIQELGGFLAKETTAAAPPAKARPRQRRAARSAASDRSRSLRGAGGPKRLGRHPLDSDRRPAGRCRRAG